MEHYCTCVQQNASPAYYDGALWKTLRTHCHSRIDFWTNTNFFLVLVINKTYPQHNAEDQKIYCYAYEL